MKLFKLNADQLDRLGTLCGVALSCIVSLKVAEVITIKEAAIVSVPVLLIQGWVIKRPADVHPTTEDVEEKNAAESPKN
ncbi:MAG: hypothetical protein NVS2B14_00480 [Chamaesiphon sp.]